MIEYLLLWAAGAVLQLCKLVVAAEQKPLSLLLPLQLRQSRAIFCSIKLSTVHTSQWCHLRKAGRMAEHTGHIEALEADLFQQRNWILFLAYFNFENQYLQIRRFKESQKILKLRSLLMVS
jgi:hypothetical protein